MPKESLGTVTRRRLLGIGFIVVLVGFITLSIAIYEKAFTSTVDVKLVVSGVVDGQPNTVGNQLLMDSDVKIDGLIVGAVKGISVKGDETNVKLSLEPDKVKQIPRDVKAQILPKTLFGEQYVDLIRPKGDTTPIAAGDTIHQDVSGGALEAQTVLDHLFPLITKVQPAELNATLTAVATALQGNGTKLGETLVNADRYLKAMNPHTQDLVDDLTRLGKVALEYNGVAPDIFATLQNLQTSAHTVIEKRQSLDNLLTTGSDTSVVLQGFLEQNKQRLITVTAQSNKIFPLLAQYSPEFPCLFAGINNLEKQTTKAIYDHQIHLGVTLDFTNQGKYVPGNQPRYVTGYGPNCFGLPNNVPFDANGNFQIPDRYRCLNDGAPLTEDKCGQSPSSAGETALNSQQENRLVNTLVAGELHTTPDHVPPAATILAAPLLRGTAVNAK